MSPDRPCRGARWFLAVFALALTATTASACDSIPGLSEDSGNGAAVLATPQADHGPCLPTYSSDVRSASMSHDGNSLLFLSGARPASLPDEAAWQLGDRAVHLMSIAEGGAASTRPLILPWDQGPEDFVPVFPTDDPSDSSPPRPFLLVEQPRTVQLAGSGSRFVLGMTRQGVVGGLAKLYTGTIPPGEEILEPGNGLSLVRINDFAGTEAVRTVHLSPDGTKLAAVVGTQGELRTYDFTSDTLYLYNVGDEGAVEISNDLPPASTSIAQTRIPALAHPGVLRASWAPDNSRLAISRYEGVGVAGVWILDHATGDASLVRTFNNSTVPHVAWSNDGQSIFALSTLLLQGNSFGNSEMRRIEAKADGDDIGDRWQLVQVRGYQTAPADLIAFGDDQSFAFTWESQVWLLQVPASGAGNASYGPVTLSPSEMRVTTGTLSLSPAADRAAFVVVDSAGGRVGLRLDVSQETCAAEGGASAPAPAEGDSGEAPAEGEADAGADEAADEEPAEGSEEEGTPSGEGG